jgi:serine/threonine protein kinase
MSSATPTQNTPVYHSFNKPEPSIIPLKELGSGSFGSVSTCQFNGTTAAVKVSNIKDPKNSSSSCKIPELIREWCFASNVNHPNVMRGLNLSGGNGEGKIVYGLMRGSFKNLVHRSDTISEQFPSIFRQMLLALDYLHSNGFSHRDISAGNFLYNRDGGLINVKISDFGSVIKRQFYKLEWCVTTEPYRAPEISKDNFGNLVDGFKV